MKRTRILFCINKLEMTGATVSLLSLLSVLDYLRYDVSLFTFTEGAGFVGRVPPEVRILPLIKNYEIYADSLPTAVRKCLRRGWFVLLIRRLFYSFLRRKMKNDTWMDRLAFEGPRLRGEYDVAIAFCCSYVWQFIVDKVEARKRVAWLDTDRRWVQGVWDRYARPADWDLVACVGEGIRARLLSDVPELKNKALVVHNVIGKDAVRAKAQSSRSTRDGRPGLRVMTVGRITDSKGQDMIIRIAQQLYAHGLAFNWYLIGPSQEKWDLFLRRAGNPPVADYLHYCGSSRNPYGWMRDCDLYVQPSRNEGWGMTVTEALAIGCPVMVSDIPAFREQIRHGENGWIVPLNEESFVKAIMDFGAGRLTLTRQGAWLEDYSSTDDFDKMCKKLGV